MQQYKFAIEAESKLNCQLLTFVTFTVERVVGTVVPKGVTLNRNRQRELHSFILHYIVIIATELGRGQSCHQRPYYRSLRIPEQSREGWPGKDIPPCGCVCYLHRGIVSSRCAIITYI